MNNEKALSTAKENKTRENKETSHGDNRQEVKVIKGRKITIPKIIILGIVTPKTCQAAKIAKKTQK